MADKKWNEVVDVQILKEQLRKIAYDNYISFMQRVIISAKRMKLNEEEVVRSIRAMYNSPTIDTNYATNNTLKHPSDWKPADFKRR